MVCPTCPNCGADLVDFTRGDFLCAKCGESFVEAELESRLINANTDFYAGA